MQYVEPKVYMIACTSLGEGATPSPMEGALDKMLQDIGAPDWATDICTEAEELIEVAGRLCYKSFAPGLNANVTRVREGNRDYLANILKSHHGSVLEHATVTFAFIGVSRILTHELVRHRPGTAFSQESGRYVRLDEFEMYEPDALKAYPRAMASLYDTITTLEASVKFAMGLIPWDKLDFHEKKRVTSALRRYAPQGQVTNIIVTANHRAWRHMIEMRTSEGAEEEIIKVFGIVADQMVAAYPNIYQDMGSKNTSGTWKGFANSKV